ncbi:hypothetical protein GPECTOR_7g959 [Gonium pectorale]|uniref:Uncharacterized protein n=1 Tax=Gonium pectorale TaxID=33097 RepID=A0A150GUJ3_GONPE|nr:hypothetical protein GPECTOR_7g959 [Gonium pectorale]|eukprot:KXZ53509.1 hypothetical protein GPECTOR_7g959 [Gonium pectorale]
MRFAVDLTADSDDEDHLQQSWKRRRFEEDSDSDVQLLDTEDSDVQEISLEEMRKAQAEPETGSEDPEASSGSDSDGVKITGATGKCYCYVCDMQASKCEFWGTGSCKADHANARPAPGWDRLRQAAREGDTDTVRQKFAKGRKAATVGP